MYIDIKSKPTDYNGTRYRSRLEARWAVFFDSLGIEYVYEPEWIPIPGHKYRPDFYLPDCDMWAEIKPRIGLGASRLAEAVKATNKDGLLIQGSPAAGFYMISRFTPFLVPYMAIEPMYFKQEDTGLIYLEAPDGHSSGPYVLRHDLETAYKTASEYKFARMVQ